MINWRRFGKLVSSREVATFFGFFILSCLIWVMYTVGTQREVTMVAPVVYYGVPDDVKMDNDFPDKIEFTISDEGSQVWRFAFADIDTIEIDLTDKFQQNKRRNIKINFKNYVRDIAFKISQTCEIVSIDPSDYQSDYLKVYTKRVPVVLASAPLAGSGFTFVSAPVIRPSEVRIRGSHKAVESVRFVTLDTIRDRIDEDKSVRVKPIRIPNVEILDRSINVSFRVERLTEKEFTLPIEVRNVPPGVIVRTFPREVKVVFRVGLSNYQQLNALGLNVVFDYNTINQGSATNMLRLESEYSLANVDYNIVPAEVEFLIEKQ